MPATIVAMETVNYLAVLSCVSGSPADVIFEFYLNRNTSDWPDMPLQIGRKCRSELTFPASRSNICDEINRLLSANSCVLDVVLSLIAEPNLVKRSAPSRAMRRQARKAGANPPALGWYKVGWTIGSEVRAQQGSGGADYTLPLHFSRAHWRRSERGKPSAERRPGRNGWWVWVKHSFKGHPDNGIKLHHYMPTVEPNGKSAATIAATQQMLKAWQAERGFHA